MKIKELIVVEGKNDITAVKRAVDAEVIATHGFGYGKKLIRTIQEAVNRQGVIIFTDPDYMGNRIRREISRLVPGCKQASLARSLAEKDEDVGIENASVEDIREALKKAHAVEKDGEDTFTMADLRYYRLVNDANASKRRQRVCDALHLGHCNGKQLLKRLNNFGITKEEIEKVLENED